MFRRAAGHDNLGYRSCGHWDELLSDFEFEFLLRVFQLVVEIDSVCLGNRYRESLSINSIKLENRKIDKIVNSTKVRSF